MGFVIHVLDVDEGEVEQAEHLEKLLRGDEPGGLDRGVNPVLAAFLENRKKEVILHERFATREGDTALGTPVVVIAEENGDELIDGHLAYGLLERTCSAGL